MFASVLMTVVAQTLMKLGGSSSRAAGEGLVNLIIAYIRSPFVVAGFGLSAIAALMWTYALSRFDFSYAYFISSVSYIFVIIISIFFFKETISLSRWIGCALILAGVLFVVRS